MRALGFDSALSDSGGQTPAAVGIRIGRLYADLGDSDGSRELQNYLEAPRFVPLNKPLSVLALGCVLAAPDHWQPLIVDDLTQRTITPQWGKVSAFAFGPEDLRACGFTGPPKLESGEVNEVRRQFVEIIEFTSKLDSSIPEVIDISPGALWNNSLGSDDGHGHPSNPITGAGYPPNVVNLGDFGRSLADFWEDGPGSDTPPGHWNEIARAISVDDGLKRRIGGTGEEVSADEWDVKLLLMLNAALHDSAVNCWALKSQFDSVRPISLIRWMGIKGQCSDAQLPSFDANGLPLIPGLIELVTNESTTSGNRHESLRGSEGKIAIMSWGGPIEPPRETSGVRWRLAGEWMPFQQWDFVTPAFPGYVSGHSTFSRAAAEVLVYFTGSPFFPGGIYERTIAANTGLHIEPGPSHEVRLQWATYFDAADSSGKSRRWGGIHIQADDFDGRRLGAKVAAAVIEKCKRLFGK